MAERLAEVLSIRLEGRHSYSRGGIWYRKAFGERDNLEDLDISLYPNHVIESAGDDWLEEDYQQFALLLDIGSATKSLIDQTRSAIKGASDLNLTLIRSTYSPGLDGNQPNVVEILLDAKEDRR